MVDLGLLLRKIFQTILFMLQVMAVEEAPRTDFYVTSVNWPQKMWKVVVNAVKIRHGERLRVLLSKNLAIISVKMTVADGGIVPDNGFL